MIVFLIDDNVIVWFCSLGFVLFGRINVLEFVSGNCLGVLENEVFGDICNFWNFVYMLMGFSGGSVVVVVVGIVLVVYGNDGGGLIWLFVNVNGLVGFKVLCGCISFGFVSGYGVEGMYIEGVVMCIVCDMVVCFDVLVGFELGDFYSCFVFEMFLLKVMEWKGKCFKIGICCVNELGFFYFDIEDIVFCVVDKFVDFGYRVIESYLECLFDKDIFDRWSFIFVIVVGNIFEVVKWGYDY